MIFSFFFELKSIMSLLKLKVIQCAIIITFTVVQDMFQVLNFNLLEI